MCGIRQNKVEDMKNAIASVRSGASIRSFFPLHIFHFNIFYLLGVNGNPLLLVLLILKHLQFSHS